VVASVLGCTGVGGKESTGAGGSDLTSCATGSTQQGVDVSHYDGTVNWTQAKAAGITFAFTKATESDNYVDPTFAANWSGMKAAGLARGAYHFFDPSVNATTQATYALATIGTLEAGDLPVVLDFEQLSGVSEATAVAGAVTFLASVTKTTGKTAILYMSSDFLAGSYPALAPYTLWVANYGASCPGMPSEWPTWTFWQSSDSGSVSGISDAVDLDSFNGSLSALTAYASGAGGGSSSGGNGSSGSGGGGSGSGSSSSGGSSSGGSSSGGSSGSSSGGCSGSVPAGSIARSTVIANAEEWVNAKLAYCQSANGQPDEDSSCSAVCNRESNPAWDPYRSDCSGFVSWAWQLPAPGLVTDEFAPFDTSESTTIDCTDMQPGDAANRNPDTGHIVIFEQWVTPGQEALFFEEPGCSSSTPYAHEFDSTVTCSGSTVNIAYEGDTFTAIRYTNIVDDPCGGSSSGGSSSGGSSGGSSSGGSSSGSCVLAGQSYPQNTCTETLQCDGGSWVARTSDASSCSTGVQPSGACITDSGAVAPENTCTSTLQCDDGVWVDRYDDPTTCL
jgi:lysozyme